MTSNAKIVLIFAVACLSLLASASFVASHIGAGDGQQEEVQIRSIQPVNESCDLNDQERETAEEETVREAGTVTVAWVLENATANDTLDAELTQTDATDKRPGYQLTVQSENGTGSNDCAVKYEATIDEATLDRYRITVFHGADKQGSISVGENGLESSRTVRASGRPGQNTSS